jgi:hypothetical protein
MNWKLVKKWKKDLQNREIKYFQFGIGYDVELEKKLKKNMIFKCSEWVV